MIFKEIRFVLFGVVICLILLMTGCSSKQLDDFTQVAQSKTDHYQVYPTAAYQTNQVPLNSLVKLSGKITQTDHSDGSSVKRNSRFVLEVDNQRYHIFNESESEFVVADRVTVFGEYYGFIQARIIQKQ